MRLLVEDEPLDIHRGRLEHHERVLDFRSGVLERAHDLDLAGRAQRPRAHTPAGLLRAAQRRGDRVPGRGGRPADARRAAVEPDRQPAADGPRARPARRPRSSAPVLESKLAAHYGLRVVLAHSTRRTRLSLAAGMDHVVDVGRPRHLADPVRGRPRPRDDHRAPRAGPAAARGQVPRLPLVLAAVDRVAARPGRREPRDRARRGLRRARRAPSAPTSTTTGRSPTSSSTATPRSSRACASPSSSCCRPRPAPRRARSPPRA